MLPDFEPHGFGRHEERAGEAVGEAFGVETGRDFQDGMAEFVGDGESLSLAPVFGIDDDERNGG